MKPNKGNGVVILDWKLYNNAIEEIMSDSPKFEKLNEDATLRREASLQRFLRKLKPSPGHHMMYLRLSHSSYEAERTISHSNYIQALK